MKKLIATSLLISFCSLAKAQQTETQEFFNAADPTQLYTKLDFNAGIIASNSSGLFGPDQWRVNLGGEFAIEKFNFGFNIPFSNLGDFYTSFEDIDLHIGYQLFNGKNFFKSSLITAGIILPADDGYGSYDDWLNTNRLFYFNYTASLKFNDKISVYPAIGLQKGSNVDEDIPRFNLTAYKASLGASYQFNTENFLLLDFNYTHTSRTFVNEKNIFFNSENTIAGNSVLTSLKYQYAITPKAQVYIKLNIDFGERFENYHNDYNSTNPGIFLGFQYFIK